MMIVVMKDIGDTANNSLNDLIYFREKFNPFSMFPCCDFTFRDPHSSPKLSDETYCRKSSTHSGSALLKGSYKRVFNNMGALGKSLSKYGSHW